MLLGGGYLFDAILFLQNNISHNLFEVSRKLFEMVQW